MPAWNSRLREWLPFVSDAAAVDPVTGNAPGSSCGSTAHPSPREMGEILHTAHERGHVKMMNSDQPGLANDCITPPHFLQ